MKIKKAILILINLFSAFSSENIIFENKIKNDKGDSCTLKDNRVGVCMEIKNCKYAHQLIKLNRYSEIVICGFDKLEPIVCCPKTKYSQALCKDRLAKTDIENKIISGIRADVGEFPHQVAIGYAKEFDNRIIEYNCGGSIIADDIIITAAHCVNRKDLQPSIVRLGRTSLDLNDSFDDTIAQDIEIQAIEMHSGYSVKSKQNDIALIKLKMPANITETSVLPICISTRQNDIPENLTITGYGTMDIKTRERSNWLLKGIVHEYSFDDCKTNYSENGKTLVESQICAHNVNGMDTCQGDSGGPMMYKHDGLSYLYGITSYGLSCGTSIPAIYTRVDKFLDWIEEKMDFFEFL